MGTSPLQYINSSNDVRSLSQSEVNVLSLSLSEVNVPSLSLSEVIVQGVVDYISQLGTNKAVGIDGISIKFLKVSPHHIAVLLTKQIKKSIFHHPAFLIVGKLLL